MDRVVAVINIAGKKIGTGNPCFVIAEAGVNHNGNIAMAKKLIDVANERGGKDNITCVIAELHS